jgi:hypothetical protein
MAVILVHRRADEMGRRLGFFEVEDKLADKLVKRGVAKLAPKAKRRARIPPSDEKPSAPAPTITAELPPLKPTEPSPPARRGRPPGKPAAEDD